MGWRLGISILLLLIYSKICVSQPRKVFNYQSERHPYIIVKLKEHSPETNKEILLPDLKATIKITKVQSLANSGSRTVFSESGINRYYKLKFNGRKITPELIKALRKSREIEFVEPFSDYELLYVPNDPEAAKASGSQTSYLSKIKAYEGWDVQRNTDEILIAIIDTGVDTAHADLSNNHYLNVNDPVNGIDDDLDGYIDNYYGWDFADSDHDIYADRDPHGTQVGGISSAVTDNELGIAGVGFNSRFLPLKIFSSVDNEFYNGFEAILYAAEMGCDIVVLSWGSPGSYSEYAHDIIRFVVEEYDVVVIAAAGNTSAELDYYPASYPFVLSVGSVNENDELSSWATYSHYIDITAQGDAVYTTNNDNKYISSQGSSYAAPQVAGAAALIRANYPEWNAIQVMEQLRITADDIYDVGSNQSYFEKLGKGRLNIYRALSDSTTRSVRMTAFDYGNGLGEYVFFDDSVFLYPEFRNILGPVDDLNIKITSLNQSVVVIDSVISIGTLDSADTLMFHSPIRLHTDTDLGYEEKIKFRLGFQGERYSDYQYFEFFSTNDFFDIKNVNINATISQDGSIGYTGGFFEYGSGWVFDQKQLLKNVGTIFSTDIHHVADNMVIDLQQQNRQNDFTPTDRIKLYKNSVAKYDGRSSFEEKAELTNRINILVEQKLLADSLNPFLIVEYRIINTSPDTISGLHVGMFVDWDLELAEENIADWLPADSLGYIYTSENNLFAGISVIGDGNISYSALDIDNKNGNIPDIVDQFNDSIKHTIISSGILEETAGDIGPGNDVGHALGIKIDTLPSNASSKIAFVLLSSKDLEDLKATLQHAREFYNYYLDSPPDEFVYRLCENDDALINPESGDSFEFYSDPYKNNLIKTDSVLEIQNIKNDTVVYIVNRDKNYPGDIRKVPVRIERPVADFLLPFDTLIIPPDESRKIKLSNGSSGSVSWLWDFGNGYGSILKHPETFYSEEGVYEIQLISSSTQGCRDTISQYLNVFQQNEIPDIVTIDTICKGSDIIIEALNTDSIHVYADSSAIDKIFSGEIFNPGPVFNDTSFWVSNARGLFESELIKTEIKVTSLFASIYHTIDTADLSTLTKLNFADSSISGKERYWYVNDEEVSTEKTFSYDYGEEIEFQVKLITEDSLGCTDSTQIWFSPDISDNPEFENYMLCKNHQVEIRSAESEVLAVYSDSAGENLIHKGRIFTTPSLSDNTVYYCSSLNNLLESERIKVNIRISEIPADFIMQPDTLYLSQGNAVEFTALNEADRYLWEIELLGSDTLRVTNRQFFDPGNYDISLQVWDSLGCTDSKNKILKVFSIVGFEDKKDDNGKIYPNPALRFFKLALEDKSKRKIDILFTDLQGKILLEKRSVIYENGLELTTGFLRSGLYLLKIIDGENIHVFRLIVP